MTQIRAMQICETLELKGLEREDAYSNNPLSFRVGSNGMVALFRFGAAVFIDMTPVEEEELLRSLTSRMFNPIAPREVELVKIQISGDEDTVTPQGGIQIRTRDIPRLLLVAEALAVSVALAYDERRVAHAFVRLGPIGTTLASGQLPGSKGGQLLQEIGEALIVQQRLASRVDLDDKPDILWDKPDLERFWAKLVDEYDLAARDRAIERKLSAIKETTQTITDLMTTRTSHRLEWYIIGLIAFEIALTLWDKFRAA